MLGIQMDIEYSDGYWVFRWIIGIQMDIRYSDVCWVFRRMLGIQMCSKYADLLCARNLLMCNVLETCWSAVCSKPCWSAMCSNLADVQCARNMLICYVLEICEEMWREKSQRPNETSEFHFCEQPYAGGEGIPKQNLFSQMSLFKNVTKMKVCDSLPQCRP